MRSYSFPGSFADEVSKEALTWHLVADHESVVPGYELRTRIRDVHFAGHFDSLRPADTGAAVSAGFRLATRGWLTEGSLTADLPVVLEQQGRRRTVAVRLFLRLVPPSADPADVRLEITVDGTEARSDYADWEYGLPQLEALLAPPGEFICCLRCQWSDYSPLGYDFMTMSCHRDAKAQYLEVQSKNDYFDMPITEIVPEPYLCDEYQRRVPGTGYRG